MTNLTHFDERGASRMVDVGEKPITQRMAKASAQVTMRTGTLALVRDRRLAKGDVLEVARLAGIMAAKQTPGLIPLCHVLPLEAVEIGFSFPDDATITAEATITIEATVRVQARTGVEMEAMVAASVAALTIYDMCKAVDRAMIISQVRLEEKSGGRSGHYQR